MITPDGVDLCDFDAGLPGHRRGGDVARHADPDVARRPRLAGALRSGDIEISGTTGMRRAAPRWLGVSSFPPVSRGA